MFFESNLKDYVWDFTFAHLQSMTFKKYLIFVWYLRTLKLKTKKLI